MTIDELSKLDDRYNKILTTEIRSQISGYIKADLLTESVVSIIKEFADFQIKDTLRGVNKRINTYIKLATNLDQEDIVIFRMHLKKQNMYYRHRMLRSVYVDELNSQISKALHTKKWGYIAATVTESLELECILRYEGK